MTQPIRQIVLDALPEGRLTTDCFRLEQAERPAPREGEVLLKVLYITLDASNRAWMQGPTYRSALRAGEVMYGRALAEVVESWAEGFKPGDLVFAETGWREWAVLPGKLLQKRPRTEPLSHLLSVYGISGLTAYFGLIRVGQQQPGDRVVISAAGGAVGTIAGQIAKHRRASARWSGIAGGADKCAWLVRELGYDAALDYKAGDLRQQVREACPDGIDLYFDNVGGEILEALPARDGQPRPHRLLRLGLQLRRRRARARAARRAGPDRHQAADHGRLHRHRLRRRARSGAGRTARLGRGRPYQGPGAHHLDGFERLPAALVGLLAGENRGKRMVRVAE